MKKIHKRKKALGFGLSSLLASALSYVPDSQDYLLFICLPRFCHTVLSFLFSFAILSSSLSVRNSTVYLSLLRSSSTAFLRVSALDRPCLDAYASKRFRSSLESLILTLFAFGSSILGLPAPSLLGILRLAFVYSAIIIYGFQISSIFCRPHLIYPYV